MFENASIREIELHRYKFAAHVDKLQALAQGGDVFPVTVELDLVDFCNHHCGWCVDPQHGNQSISQMFAERLLEELAGLGVEGIVFKGGGEPMLHEGFGAILTRARDLGFETGVVTNGSRLLDHYRTVVEKASYLRTSIDGPTVPSHRRLHGSDDFDEIVEGLARALAYRREKEQRHPIIGLSFALDHAMRELAGEAVALGRRLGVDYLLLRPPFFEEVGRNNTMTPSQKQELFDTFEQARRSCTGAMEVLIDYWVSDAEANQLAATSDSPRRSGCPYPQVNGIEHVTRRCQACPLLAVVAADGRVYPCCNLRFLDEWALGVVDYDRCQDFRSVWNSDRRKQVMTRIRKVECLRHCTHPMSRYNEIIEYLRGPQYHKGFI